MRRRRYRPRRLVSAVRPRRSLPADTSLASMAERVEARAPGRAGPAWPACACRRPVARPAARRRGGRPRAGTPGPGTRRPRWRSRCRRGRSPGCAPGWDARCPAQAGDGEAPLVVVPLPVHLDDGRVDDGLGSLADVVDEQPLLHPDLGGGQAGTLGRRTWSRPCRRPGWPASRRPGRPRGPPAAAPGRRRGGRRRRTWPHRTGAGVGAPAAARPATGAGAGRSGVDGVDLHPQPPGGPAAPRPDASHSVRWSGARTSHRSVVERRHRRSPRTAPRPVGAGGRPGPRQHGQGAEGREPEWPAQRPLRPGQQAGVGVDRGPQTSWSAIRVCTSTRPPPVAGPDQPGRPGPAGRAPPPRRAKRGASRCWSKSRKATGVGPVRPGAAQPRCPTTSRAPSASVPGAELRRDLHGLDPGQRPSSSSVARVTPIRSDFKRVASHTAHTARAVVAAPPAAQRRRRRRAGPSAPPHRGAPGQRPAGAQASSRIRPVRLRTHTTRPSGLVEHRHGAAGPAARRTARCGDRRRCGRPPRPRPAPALDGPVRW